jgi:hypothetical protein
LLAEEYDVGLKRFAGNFPQGFSHIALNTAYNLAYAGVPAYQRASGSAPEGKSNSDKNTKWSESLRRRGQESTSEAQDKRAAQASTFEEG